MVKSIIQWEAEDGTKFDTEQDANQHETICRFQDFCDQRLEALCDTVNIGVQMTVLLHNEGIRNEFLHYIHRMYGDEDNQLEELSYR